MNEEPNEGQGALAWTFYAAFLTLAWLVGYAAGTVAGWLA